jgi:hypothetical protein
MQTHEDAARRAAALLLCGAASGLPLDRAAGLMQLAADIWPEKPMTTGHMPGGDMLGCWDAALLQVEKARFFQREALNRIGDGAGLAKEVIDNG